MNKIYSNNYAYKIRNLFKIRPNLYITPPKKNKSVSDFFYWSNIKDFQTQFALMNIGSHILPNLKQKDNIEIYIYNYDGKFLKKLNFVLDDLQSIKINFSKYNLNGFGSFFVFHKLDNLDYLSDNNIFVTERGYVGYKNKYSVWNYMHGNHNAAYLDDSNTIKSLMPTSFFFNEYIPQTRFDDVNEFKLIFNNVNNFPIPFKIELYGIDNELIDILSYKCNYLNTLEIKVVKKDKLIKFVKIKSKLLFCRPVIFKYQLNDFDIFHG